MARAVAKLPTLSGGSPEMEVVVPHGDSEPAPGASAEKIEACNAAVSRYAAFLVLEEFDGSMSWSCIRKIGSCWYDFSPLGYDDQLRETGESGAEAEAIASDQASSPRPHDASLQPACSIMRPCWVRRAGVTRLDHLDAPSERALRLHERLSGQSSFDRARSCLRAWCTSAEGGEIDINAGSM